MKILYLIFDSMKDKSFFSSILVCQYFVETDFIWHQKMFYFCICRRVVFFSIFTPSPFPQPILSATFKDYFSNNFDFFNLIWESFLYHFVRLSVGNSFATCRRTRPFLHTNKDLLKDKFANIHTFRLTIRETDNLKYWKIIKSMIELLTDN